MRRASAAKQIPIFTAKNFRLFMNQKDWKFILIAAVISFLVCMIVGEDMFTTYESTKSGFFAIVSAAIWIGIFNSIQKICKEHSTITSEYRSGLHISAYIAAHIIFDFFVCLIQSLILIVVCCVFIDFPSEGILFGSPIIEYFITLFLITWGSDIMGIMISASVSTPNAAMTAMPFVLILQLVMGGVLFELTGWESVIADVTFSKWGMSALGCIGNMNDKDLPLKLKEVYPMIERLETEPIYDSTVGTLLAAWGCLILISAVCAVIGVLMLKLRNKDS